MLTYQFVLDIQITFHFPISVIIDCHHSSPSVNNLDCYSNQMCSSVFDSYIRLSMMRRGVENQTGGEYYSKNRRVESNKKNSKVKPKFAVDKCNGFRSIWIQIETRKRFGELLEK